MIGMFFVGCTVQARSLVRAPRWGRFNAVRDGTEASEALLEPANAPPGQAATQAELQRAVVAEQQRALVQQVIAKLTEVSFDTCLKAKPDSTLSAGERACIHTVVGKYLDTSEFVLGRSTKKSQQAQMLS